MKQCLKEIKDYDHQDTTGFIDPTKAKTLAEIGFRLPKEATTGAEPIIKSAGSTYSHKSLFSRLKPIRESFPDVDKGLRPLDDVKL